MINFRFHIVSLVGVFLALALGIVVGSTVVDDGIVRQLRTEIRTAEERSDEVEAQSAQLRDDLDRLEDYIADSSHFTVEDRLVGVPVAVVAVRGVNHDAVDDAVELLRAAGADLPGVVWLEGAWRLDGDDVERLAEVLDVSAALNPDALRSAGLDLLARRLATRPEATGEHDAATSTTAPEADSATAPPTTAAGPAASDALVALGESGFVTLDRDEDDDVDPADFPAGRVRVLVVGGPRADVGEIDMLAPLARALEAADVPVVAAEVHVDDEDGPARGETLAGVRDNEALAESVSTVDDLDLDEGRIAALLALDAIGSGVVGHYGYGKGAEQALPEWNGA